MRKQAIKHSFSLISSKKTGPFQGIVRSKEKKHRQDSSEAYPYCLSSHAQSSLAFYFALHDSLRDTGPTSASLRKIHKVSPEDRNADKSQELNVLSTISNGRTCHVLPMRARITRPERLVSHT